MEIDSLLVGGLLSIQGKQGIMNLFLIKWLNRSSLHLELFEYYGHLRMGIQWVI